MLTTNKKVLSNLLEADEIKVNCTVGALTNAFYHWNTRWLNSVASWGLMLSCLLQHPGLCCQNKPPKCWGRNISYSRDWKTISQFLFHVYCMPTTDDICIRIIPLRRKEKFFLAEFFNKWEIGLVGWKQILNRNFSELWTDSSFLM